MIDAESYTISIRKEKTEGGLLYVARVAELSDVREYADTFEEAYSLVVDTITTAQQMCLEQDIPFPKPFEFQNPDVSGRVTLRLPKFLHAKIVHQSDLEGVSLNSYIVTRLSMQSGVEQAVQQLEMNFLRQQIPIAHSIFTNAQEVRNIIAHESLLLRAVRHVVHHVGRTVSYSQINSDDVSFQISHSISDELYPNELRANV